jgi:hypothetical protein
MALDITKAIEIIELMENYIDRVRPKEEIRPQLDLAYEIEGQSIILTEIRPRWNNPSVIDSFGYAKATFVKRTNIWRIFWRRASGKWENYEPNKTVERLSDFLRIVDKDEYGCFKG